MKDLHVHRRPPPAARVQAVARLAQAHHVVVDEHVADPAARLAADRDAHPDAEGVVPHRHVPCGEGAASEAFVEAVVGRAGAAHARLDRDIVVAARNVVVLDQHIFARVGVNAIGVAPLGE